MIYQNLSFDQERALYGIHDAKIKNCRFTGPQDGESFLKETQRIQVEDCFMDLRYPLWHVTDGKIINCQLTPNCRAALWYDKNIQITDSSMMGIKAIRECENVTLKKCNSQFSGIHLESSWNNSRRQSDSPKRISVF